MLTPPPSAAGPYAWSPVDGNPMNLLPDGRSAAVADGSSHCGSESLCKVDTLTRLPSLNGDAEYGRCVDCTTLDGGRGRREFVRSAVARLLEVDVDNLALDRLRVDIFSERPSARPDRPNPEPWSHANLDALAGQYREREATLAGCAGGPCAWCGNTVTGLQRTERITLFDGASTVLVPASGGWRSLRGVSNLGTARGDLEQCESCTHWFNERWGGYGSQVRRSLAAAALCGLVRHGDSMMRTPFPDFGETVGLQFWHETGLSEGATSPWSHVDIGGLRRRASEALYAYSPSVARDFPIDVDNTATIGW